MRLDAHAALHEEGRHEGGDDRQDEVAELLGGDVFLKEFHNVVIISFDNVFLLMSH